MLNLQLVAGEHGLFGGHESEGIRFLLFIPILAVVIHNMLSPLHFYNFGFVNLLYEGKNCCKCSWRDWGRHKVQIRQTYLPSPLKLTILPNNQFEYYQVEYFKKYSTFIKYQYLKLSISLNFWYLVYNTEFEWTRRISPRTSESTTARVKTIFLEFIH